VVVERPGHAPILLDLGTGLRYFGKTQPDEGPFTGVALVTHLHWDHVQGLPFFTPILTSGAHLKIYCPTGGDESLSDTLKRFVGPPFFPIEIGQLPGTVELHECADESFDIDGIKVTARSVPHLGPTNGYRLESDNATVAYISDHQQPVNGSFDVAANVLELADGVDLLIHDAQFTSSEFAAKTHWGHSTVNYALHVAKEAGVKAVALFHHDPSHDDDALHHMMEEARQWGDANGIEVLGASEGLTISFA
jgi:ribonuclease BN (tRNA processing enzyme)